MNAAHFRGKVFGRVLRHFLLLKVSGSITPSPSPTPFYDFYLSVIFGNLNINSLPNNFDQLREIGEIVLKYVDVLVVTETKLDDTFLMSQFLVTGFSVPHRLDRHRNGGGIMIFIRDDIPSRMLRSMFFQMILKVYLLSLILEKLSGYFLGHVTDQLKVIHIISII